jgi:HK97 family phage major capsid protein
MNTLLDEARQKHAESLERLSEWDSRIQSLPDDAKPEESEYLKGAFEKTKDEVRRWAETVERQEVITAARVAVKPQNADENGAKPQKIEVNEPLTYERGGPNRFVRDLIDAKGGNLDAMQRLQRHASEMRVELRDLTTVAGAGGEFVAPKYLQERWIELLRAGRPTADAVTSLPLVPGTNSVTLPRLATGAATAIQTADNAAVQETDPTTNSVTATLKTIAGQVDLSRQLFEFSDPSFDEVIFRDLARDYATKLDIQVLSGSGAAGQALGIRNVAGINAVTYTDATPTPGEAWPKLTDAIQRITSAFLNPDTLVMHPRRAAFFLAAVDTTGRPLFNSSFNNMGDISGTVSNGAAGALQGMRVVVDPNLPTNLGAGTNEDLILALDSNQILLWEEATPRTKVFEDVGSGTLTVRLQVYGFFMFMANRYPAAISTIGGTGLIAPTF